MRVRWPGWKAVRKWFALATPGACTFSLASEASQGSHGLYDELRLQTWQANFLGLMNVNKAAQKTWKHQALSLGLRYLSPNGVWCVMQVPETTPRIANLVVSSKARGADDRFLGTHSMRALALRALLLALEVACVLPWRWFGGCLEFSPPPQPSPVEGEGAIHIRLTARLWRIEYEPLFLDKES